MIGGQIENRVKAVVNKIYQARLTAAQPVDVAMLLINPFLPDYDFGLKSNSSSKQSFCPQNICPQNFVLKKQDK